MRGQQVHLRERIPNAMFVTLSTYFSCRGKNALLFSQRCCIYERFGNNVGKANFAVFGDFNDTPDAECLKPILDSSLLENVVERLPKDEQWTYYWESKHETNQFDYILLSRALSKKNPKTLPKIERQGLAKYARAYKGPNFEGVGKKGTEASDHCAVFMEIKI